MLPKLLLIFIAVPMIELALLIEIGSRIGSIETIGIIILTGAIGAYLAKQEGLRTIFKIQENLRQGIIPAREMVDGLIILLSGAFLITPGFLTDIVGFVLLIPYTREIIKIWLYNKFKDKIHMYNDQFEI